MPVVLLVDDSPDYFELVQVYLEEELSQPVQCACAQSVAEAHRILADPSYEGQIAAAIIDLRLGDGGDIEKLVDALPPETPYWRFSSFTMSEVDCELIGCGFYSKSQLDELAKSVATELARG